MLAKVPKEACWDQDIWIPVRNWETDCTYNAWLSVVLLKKKERICSLVLRPPRCPPNVPGMWKGARCDQELDGLSWLGLRPGSHWKPTLGPRLAMACRDNPWHSGPLWRCNGMRYSPSVQSHHGAFLIRFDPFCSINFDQNPRISINIHQVQDVQVRSAGKGPLVLKVTATPHGVPSTKALTSGPVPGKPGEIHPRSSIWSGTRLA